MKVQVSQKSKGPRNIASQFRGKVIISKDDAFDTLCAIGEIWLSSPRNLKPIVHFTADTGRVDIHYSLFPTSTDGSFEKYSRRIFDTLSTRQFLLYTRGFSQYFEDLTVLAHNFVETRCQYPVAFSALELEFYVGQYDWTPIGIHRERCTNFHHVISGEKEIMIWPEDALIAQKNRLDLAVAGGTREDAAQANYLLLPNCETHKINRGQTLLFPSGCWHVGASSSLSIAFDIACFP